MPQLFVRLYAVCADASETTSAKEALLQALADFEPSLRNPPYRYYKIPGYVGFDIDLATATVKAYDALQARSAAGWYLIEDVYYSSAVWNWTEGLVFLHPNVRWAEIQFDTYTRP